MVETKYKSVFTKAQAESNEENTLSEGSQKKD